MDLLGVPAGMLAQYGAVSGEVAGGDGRRRAHALRRRPTRLAVTGVAGPDGGTAEKPVGLVYVGCAGPEGTRVRESSFPGDRAACARTAPPRRCTSCARPSHGEPRGWRPDPRCACASSSPATCRGGSRRDRAWQARSLAAPRRSAPHARRCTSRCASSADVARRACRTSSRRSRRRSRWRRCGVASGSRSSCPRTGRKRVVALALDDPPATACAGCRPRSPRRSPRTASTSPRDAPGCRTSRWPVSAAPVNLFPCKTSTSRSLCRPDGPV